MVASYRCNTDFGFVFVLPLLCQEIIEVVKTGPLYGAPFRPDTKSNVKCADFVERCIQDCWNEDPELRPDFKYIRTRLKPMQQGL